MSEKPYYEKLFEAVIANDNEAVEKIVEECLVEMTHKFMGVVASYDWNDLPFVIAVMKITERTLEMTLDRVGEEFVDMICSRTSSVAIDLDELRRQVREEYDDGKE